MTKRVLLVGHCGFDAPRLSRMLSSNFDVRVAEADSCEEAVEEVRSGEFSLVLINRILDATGEDGVALIQEIRAQSADGEKTPSVMLISNYEDAQARACAAGAKPGFGKSDSMSRIIDVVRPFL